MRSDGERLRRRGGSVACCTSTASVVRNGLMTNDGGAGGAGGPAGGEAGASRTGETVRALGAYLQGGGPSVRDETVGDAA